MRYRKRPVVVEAFQYDGDLKGTNRKYYVPDWAVEAFEKGIITFSSDEPGAPPRCLAIRTLEGVMLASIGDFIIRGVNGELYPCKPDIFEKTYEAVS